MERESAIALLGLALVFGFYWFIFYISRRAKRHQPSKVDIAIDHIDKVLNVVGVLVLWAATIIIPLVVVFAVIKWSFKTLFS